MNRQDQSSYNTEEGVVGYHAGYSVIKNTIAQLKAAGIPTNKMMIGWPTYAKYFELRQGCMGTSNKLAPVCTFADLEEGGRVDVKDGQDSPLGESGVFYMNWAANDIPYLREVKRLLLRGSDETIEGTDIWNAPASSWKDPKSFFHDPKLHARGYIGKLPQKKGKGKSDRSAYFTWLSTDDVRDGCKKLINEEQSVLADGYYGMFNFALEQDNVDAPIANILAECIGKVENSA